MPSLFRSVALGEDNTETESMEDTQFSCPMEEKPTAKSEKINVNTILVRNVLKLLIIN